MMMATRLVKWTNFLYATLKFAITTAQCQILRWSRDECSLQHSSISVRLKFIFFHHLRLSASSSHLLHLSEVQMLFPVPCFHTNSIYVLLRLDTEFYTCKRQLVILHLFLRWFFCLFQFLFTAFTNILSFAVRGSTFAYLYRYRASLLMYFLSQSWDNLKLHNLST